MIRFLFEMGLGSHQRVLASTDAWEAVSCQIIIGHVAGPQKSQAWPDGNPAAGPEGMSPFCPPFLSCLFGFACVLRQG